MILNHQCGAGPRATAVAGLRRLPGARDLRRQSGARRGRRAVRPGVRCCAVAGVQRRNLHRLGALRRRGGLRLGAATFGAVNALGSIGLLAATGAYRIVSSRSDGPDRDTQLLSEITGRQPAPVLQQENEGEEPGLAPEPIGSGPNARRAPRGPAGRNAGTAKGWPETIHGPGPPLRLRAQAELGSASAHASFVRFGPAPPPAACSIGGTSGSAVFSSPRKLNFRSSPSPSVSTTTM